MTDGPAAGRTLPPDFFYPRRNISTWGAPALGYSPADSAPEGRMMTGCMAGVLFYRGAVTTLKIRKLWKVGLSPYFFL